MSELVTEHKLRQDLEKLGLNLRSINTLISQENVDADNMRKALLAYLLKITTSTHPDTNFETLSSEKIGKDKLKDRYLKATRLKEIHHISSELRQSLEEPEQFKKILDNLPSDRDKYISALETIYQEQQTLKKVVESIFAINVDFEKYPNHFKMNKLNPEYSMITLPLTKIIPLSLDTSPLLDTTEKAKKSKLKSGLDSKTERIKVKDHPKSISYFKKNNQNGHQAIFFSDRKEVTKMFTPQNEKTTTENTKRMAFALLDIKEFISGSYDEYALDQGEMLRQAFIEKGIITNENNLGSDTFITSDGAIHLFGQRNHTHITQNCITLIESPHDFEKLLSTYGDKKEDKENHTEGDYILVSVYKKNVESNLISKDKTTKIDLGERTYLVLEGIVKKGFYKNEEI